MHAKLFAERFWESTKRFGGNGLMAYKNCSYALGMQSTGSGFADSELTSFSSLLEKLSGCGIDDAPGKTRSQEGRQSSRAGAEVADVTYKPWPSAPRPWQSPTVRSSKAVTTPQRRVKRGAKTLLAQNQTFQAETCCYEGSNAGPSVSEKVAVNRSGPELANALRRSAVSIRLNEDEMTLLRQRAAESGISISEYVRSCVVEADVLRVQVKQVVADMRSQPVAAQAPGALGKQDSIADLSTGKRKLSGFWSRWAWILLGTRENVPLKLQPTGSTFRFS